MSYRVIKTYGHERGLSACFRQWPATHSHCRFLHGYALAITLTFEASTLDSRSWVIDFGGLKEIKAWLEEMLDHKTLVAADDPLLQVFMDLQRAGLIDLKVVPAVGCEGFAEMIACHVRDWMGTKDFENDVKLVSVEVREHSGNAAVRMLS